MSNEMKEVNDVNYFCSFHAKALQSTDVTKCNFIWKCITNLSKQRLSGCYERPSVSSPAGDVLWWCTVQEQNDKEKSHCLKMYGPKCVVFLSELPTLLFFKYLFPVQNYSLFFFLLVLSLCRGDIFFFCHCHTLCFCENTFWF